MHESTKTVRIGGQGREIEAFSTRRFGQVVKAVGELFTAYAAALEDMATFRKQWGENHPRTVTRQMCEEGIQFANRQAAQPGITTEQAEVYARMADGYQRMLDGSLSDKDEITVPGTPSEEQVWISVLPKAIEEYEEQVARLVGLVVMTNEQFAVARREHRANPDGAPSLRDVMLERGDEVIDTTEVDDVIDLLVSGAELLLGDMESRRARLGKLQEVARKALNPATDDEQDEPTSDSTTGSETSSTSSTGSPEPTDGPKTPSSTGSPSAAPST